MEVKFTKFNVPQFQQKSFYKQMRNISTEHFTLNQNSSARVNITRAYNLIRNIRSGNVNVQ